MGRGEKERGSISNGRNIKEDTKASKRKRKQERTSPSLPHLLDDDGLNERTRITIQLPPYSNHN
jgi:hypothetical protein